MVYILHAMIIAISNVRINDGCKKWKKKLTLASIKRCGLLWKTKYHQLKCFRFAKKIVLLSLLKFGN